MICKIPRPDIPRIFVARVNKSLNQPPKLKLIGRGQSDSWLSTKNFRNILGMKANRFFFRRFSNPDTMLLMKLRVILIGNRSNSKNLQIYFR